MMKQYEKMQCLQTKHTNKSQQNGSAKTTSGGANKAVCSCGGHGGLGPLFLGALKIKEFPQDHWKMVV